jgi:predicted glycoside hydrolase/deacetylase ChbG (UPF0249 family)
VLCADDYGIAPGVGGAIRDLIGRGRLSATSCMVVWPDFAAEARRLAPHLGNVDVGLHLTLTLDRPLSRLMAEAYAGRLDARAIAGEVERQIDLFAAAFGRPPDFIDGHQHVHLLPTVREAVATHASRLGAYLRLTDEPLAAIRKCGVAPAKAAFLSLLARPLARRARRLGIARNSGFRGARSFAEPGAFDALFRRMIADAPAGCLIMCHPGLADATLAARDPVTRSREAEYRYLAGDSFPTDLAAAGLRLTQLKDTVATS